VKKTYTTMNNYEPHEGGFELLYDECCVIRREPPLMLERNIPLINVICLFN
jgi:hypothetical protein